MPGFVPGGAPPQRFRRPSQPTLDVAPRVRSTRPPPHSSPPEPLRYLYMRILELTQRGDELHAICTGILYCFASRVVNMAVESPTGVGSDAWRAGDEQCPGFRAEGQRMGTFWASVIADKNKDSYSYPVEKTIL